MEKETLVGNIEERWQMLCTELEETFGKKPDLNAVLMLIGIRELGTAQNSFTKEQKIDLMHIAVCSVLAPSGFYRLQGKDKDGWPHWEQITKPPFLGLQAQEEFLKYHVIEYFAAL